MGAVELVLVRHGESTANVAAAAAEGGQAEAIDLPCRDADIELSQTGHDQADALGERLGSLPTARRPEAVWASPYRRAHDTAAIALRTAGLDLAIRTDERLRDRELGILDGLTARGVQVRFPAEAARSAWLGKFYHRPPGGESWVDLAQRLRTLLADVDRIHDGRRVLVVCHDALVVMTRYVCEGLTEAEVLDIEKVPVRNASLSRLVRPSGEGWWTLDTYNDVAHLEALTAQSSDPPR
jgi:broad specificity phosphatase PhoE